jgi:hypothetical protein
VECGSETANFSVLGSYDYIDDGSGGVRLGKIRRADDLIRINMQRIIHKASIIDHEGKHLRLFMNDFIRYGYFWYGAGDHHYFMDNPDEYDSHDKKFLYK